ncbi:MAG: acylphosphatase [Spirochaeta sp.]|jgi:acylphosphatase|nr:acylphosphatase [Spirochaeta sp.]
MSEYQHDSDTAFQATIRGHVQGVGFRYYTQREARRQGITGWVKNRADGAVEVLAEGSAAELDAFAAWLQEGPPGARVRNVEMHRPIPPTGHLRFTVEY